MQKIIGLSLLVSFAVFFGKSTVYSNDFSVFQKNKFLLPRYLTMPKITFRDAPSNDFPLKKLILSTRRFHLVAIIASWSQHSKDLVKAYNSIYDKFEERDVGIIALSSHDTIEGLKKFKELTQPKFYVGFASDDFISAMKNPSVPTVWTIDNNNRAINILSMPEEKDLNENIKNILKMTSF
jgi:hypothetical protein